MPLRVLALLCLMSACQKPLNDPDAGTPLGGDVADAGVEAKLAAVAQVANTDADCRKLGDFVWLIGDARGTFGGQQFGHSVTPEEPLKIASATKWLFGAYVAERFKSDPASIDWEAMRMRSGYVDLNYSSCLFTDTVEGCANAGNNEHHTAAEDGFFYYGGGHFQQYALTLGLGALGDDSLAAELSSRLGSDLHLGFNSPQLAGGGQMAPSGYATFLTVLVSLLFIPPVLATGAATYLNGALGTQFDTQTVALAIVAASYGLGILNIRVNAWVTGMFLICEVAALLVIVALGFGHVSQPLSVLSHPQIVDHGLLGSRGVGDDDAHFRGPRPLSRISGGSGASTWMGWFIELLRRAGRSARASSRCGSRPRRSRRRGPGWRDRPGRCRTGAWPASPAGSAPRRAARRRARRR